MTPIRAPPVGTLPGYGNVVVLTHGFGFKTFYGHNHKNLVRKGQHVTRGQQIATVGNTGYSTGAHLHYEVLLNDTPHDPLKYIVDEERRANLIRGQEFPLPESCGSRLLADARKPIAHPEGTRSGR